MKLILSVMILILMIPNLTFAQVNSVKFDVNNQIPALIPQEKTNKKTSVVGTILILSVSSAIGGIIGVAINVPNAAPTFCIGALTLPVISYELISTIRGVKRKPDKWFVKIGANTTFTNYDKHNKRINCLIGAGRSYHISDVFSLNWEIFYKSRTFLLKNQRVYYFTYPSDEIRYYDIDVSNNYIDIFIMPSAKLFDFSKSKINISFGPFLSAPIANNTKYFLNHLSKNITDPNDVDFNYHTEEPEKTRVFIGLSFGVEYEFGKETIQLKYCKALNSTHQIYRVNDKSRLNTLELIIGYKF